MTANQPSFHPVRSSNVTQIIDRLEALGLIKRTRSVCDRRSYLLSLTPRALTLFPDPAP